MPFMEMPSYTSSTPVVTSGLGYGGYGGHGGGYGYGGYGYGNCGYGGLFGGSTGGALVGGLLGALIGEGGLFGNRGHFGHDGHKDGCCGSHLAHEVLLDGQSDIREEIPKQTIALQHDILDSRMNAAQMNFDSTLALQKCCCDTDRDVALLGKDIALASKDDEMVTMMSAKDIQSQMCQSDSMTRAEIAKLGFDNAILGQQAKYDTAMQICGVNHNIDKCCCENEKLALQNKYDTALQLCGIDHHIDKCCCDNEKLALQNKYDAAIQLCGVEHNIDKGFWVTNSNIDKEGSETRFRDLENRCHTDRQLEEIKCLIKTTEKDSILREQTAKICALEAEKNKLEIISAMKPVAAVPAYIQPSPYQAFQANPVCSGFHNFGGCSSCF